MGEHRIPWRSAAFAASGLAALGVLTRILPGPALDDGPGRHDAHMLAALEQRTVTFADPSAIRVPADLRDHQGAVFDATRLRGRWSVVFAGYTSCPHICPMTLRILSAWLDQQPTSDPGTKPQVVFVTVDPERDVREVVAPYLAGFHKDIVGVTGPPQEMQSLVSSLRAGFTRSADGGQIDHSTSLFVVSPAGKMVGAILTYTDASVVGEEFADITGSVSTPRHMVHSDGA